MKPERFHKWAALTGSKKCYLCGVHLTPGSATKDHVVPNRFLPPEKRGYNNIKLACQRCNSAKGSITLDVIFKWLPILIRSQIGRIELEIV